MRDISNIKGPEFQPSYNEPEKVSKKVTVNEEATTETVDAKTEALVNSLSENPPPKEDTFRAILKLLMEMTPIIQRASTALAEQSRVLPTAMIAFYTELISKIKLVDESTPGFTKDEIKDDGERIRKIQAKNDKLMNVMDTYRSQRDLWSNEAKKVQAVLNQSIEAANQNTELLNAFFQQLRELTAALTRS